MVIDGVLYHLDPKQKLHRQVIVPEHLKKQIMEETQMAGHFSGHQLFNTLSTHWWWRYVQ